MRGFGIPLLLAMAGTLWAGNLTNRFHLNLDRVLTGGPPHYTNEMVLADVIPRPIRRFTNFSGDLSGRYIAAVALASPPAGRDMAMLKGLVSRLISYQKPDGHFGGPMSSGKIVRDDMALLWGNGRLLIGLLEYYAQSKQPEALRAARRLGDFMVRVAPRFNARASREQIFAMGHDATGYICWTQSIEGLVALYKLTSEEDYLQLARELAARTRRFPQQHSHGFLSTLRGIGALYQVTRQARYLEQLEREWQGILDSNNVLVDGGIPEYFNNFTGNDEGCSEADWLRLNLMLWRLTRRRIYLRRAELTLFNEFEFNEFDTGDFGHHHLLSSGIGHEAARAWWCCTLHGLRAFPVIFENAFHAEDGMLAYDLAVDGAGEGAGLKLRADSKLELDGAVRLQVLKARAKPATLAIRRPRWAGSVEISLGGKRLPAAVRDGYSRITRHWKAGETVLVRYRMRTRTIERLGPAPRRRMLQLTRQARRKQIAIFHGPWLLAVDDVDSPAFYNQPSTRNRLLLPARGRDGSLSLQPAPSAKAGVRPFTVPVAHFLVKYLNGGYRTETGTTTLRPLAEYTATRCPSAWRFWFHFRSK